MRAKFYTEDSLAECYKYTAPQALGAVILGLVIAVLAFSVGITVAVIKSIIGGSLLLISLLMLALIILYYGFIGANKMIKNNTILVDTKTKETILTDEKVIEVTNGELSSETREFDYKYVNMAKFSKGMFTLYLTDGTSILFSQDKLVEGDINQIREFLSDKFAKAYIDKTFLKEQNSVEQQDDNAFLQEQEPSERELSQQTDDQSEDKN